MNMIDRDHRSSWSQPYLVLVETEPVENKDRQAVELGVRWLRDQLAECLELRMGAYPDGGISLQQFAAHAGAIVDDSKVRLLMDV
jgi:hypothetical protein